MYVFGKKNKLMKKILYSVFILTVLNFTVCCSSNDPEDVKTVLPIPTPIPLPNPAFPLSDQTNSGNWTLNTEVSDEFEGTVIDETKWLVQGRNGVFESNHKGRIAIIFKPSHHA